MSELVVLLSTGKGTWSEVAKLINSYEWDKIFIVTNEFGKSTFNKKENMEFVIINPDAELKFIKNQIYTYLKDKNLELEVALNFVSGTGKEHMALLSAILKLGLGVRLVTFEDQMKEI